MDIIIYANVQMVYLISNAAENVSERQVNGNSNSYDDDDDDDSECISKTCTTLFNSFEQP